MNKISIKPNIGKTQTPVTYTGSELLDPESNAPLGFYKNKDTSYSGIVLRTKAYCTYFDVKHNEVLSFGSIWKDDEFIFRPDIKGITVSVG